MGIAGNMGPKGIKGNDGATSIDIIDNLTSNDTTKALSAKQGKILNESIGANSNNIIIDNVTSSNTNDILSAKQGITLNKKIERLPTRSIGPLYVNDCIGGDKWIQQTIPNTHNYNIEYRNICWSPELHMFCACSSYTKNSIITSTDGINWIDRPIPITDTDYMLLCQICWAPEIHKFCINSCYGINSKEHKMLVSSNGISWEIICTGISTKENNNASYGICWSPKLKMFCATTYDSEFVLTSYDGVTWIKRSLNVKDNWLSICWSEELEMFCALTYNSSNNINKVATSSDGIDWNVNILPSTINNDVWSSICWAPELHMFCAVNSFYKQQSAYKVLISSDGINWQIVRTSIEIRSLNICWCPELHVFCATLFKTSEPYNKIAISNDGIYWRYIYLPQVNNKSTYYCLASCWSRELGIFAITLQEENQKTNALLTSTPLQYI